MEIAARHPSQVHEVGVMSPGETGPAAGSPDAADGEQPLAACGPGLGAGQGAGWIWGDPADGIPADAPLHTLLLAASRIMGAYYASTLVHAGLRISPAGLGVLRVLLAGDGRVVRLYVTDKGRQICQDYLMLAGPHWRSAFDFVNPADEPVIRRFFIDMIRQFSELTRKERGR